MRQTGKELRRSQWQIGSRGDRLLTGWKLNFSYYYWLKIYFELLFWLMF